MREILFRGKRFDNDQWQTSSSIMQIYDFVYNQEKLVSLWDYESGWQRVYPETVGQFTGLYDKKGERIFEGDIVNIEYPHNIVRNTVIKYIGASFYGTTVGDIWDLDGFYKLEVIGNIHDNPELLEEGENG